VPDLSLPGAVAMFAHRMLAIVVVALFTWTMIRARTMTPRSPLLVRLATIALVLVIAQIFVGVSTRSHVEGDELAARLRELGYETADLSRNEMAKLHVRHMVGGRSPDVASERVCRFEFPERPGALMQFLDALGGRWNISLFHYRNHGADFGRVLTAFEVPESERSAFDAFLSGLDYHFQLDENNEAYRRFLGHDRQQ
jgi:hypothetical protein